MAATSSYPTLMSARWDRKAGRYDFNRFDHLSASAACIGYKSIGKVNIDCRFLFKKSRWGVLGLEQNPAGIIYMDINFDQPRNCKLVSATVEVMLNEDDQGLEPYRNSNTDSSGRDHDRPVQITDWYGPKQISGTPHKMNKKRTDHFTPNVNILGNGVGGLGIDREKEFEYTSKWTFNGSLHPDFGSTTYRTLKWVMEENDLVKFPVHSNRIHTAFAFESDGQPFLMEVRISGNLEKISDKMKDKFRKKFKPGPKDTPTTLVCAYQGRTRQLDELAMGLERAMEMENYASVPVELPDAQAATYHPVPAQGQQVNANPAVEASNASGEAILDSAGGAPIQSQIRIEDTQPIGLLGARSVGILDNTAEPSLEALARFGDGSYFAPPVRRSPPPRREDISEDVSEVSEHTVTTLVNSHVEEESQELMPKGTGGDTSRPADVAVDKDTMAMAMEFVVVRMLIQLMIILGLLESKPGRNDRSDSEDDGIKQEEVKAIQGERKTPSKAPRPQGRQRLSKSRYK
ncbi:hypothetical protein NKR23_g9580 [Pleurostoma richardsiae]|uniref:Uncharacterized protein n=1 Tax=Pleurostoma richardsiae TaxID=41990 RepID=A0AA38VMQ8_9PEZI|nr:hypothetical protein NKR23_g9580 [Pleurostoma richardsiae]